jgi:hypothetical protein
MHSRFDSIQGQVTAVAAGLTGVQARLDGHDHRFANMESAMADLRNKVVTSSDTGGHAGSMKSEASGSTRAPLGPTRFQWFASGYSSAAANGLNEDDEARELFPPSNRRRTIVVMKFPNDTEKCEIEPVLVAACETAGVGNQHLDV